MNLRPSQRILRALMSCAEYHRSSAHIIIFKITAVHFLHLYAARLQGFLSFSFSIGWRRALPYPLRYCRQLQAKPVAVRCPAKACSYKHVRHLPGISHKKQEKCHTLLLFAAYHFTNFLSLSIALAAWRLCSSVSLLRIEKLKLSLGTTIRSEFTI